LSFDVVVGTDTPASSKITLTFDSTVDLDALSSGAVLNTPGTGKGQVGTANANDSILFDYGTGSFTFDNVVVVDNDQSKGEKDTLTFQVNLGNSLTAGSAFRVTLGDAVTPAGLTDISGAASLAYQSTNADGSVVIENGTGEVAKEVSQFDLAVKTPYDKLINRDDLTEFNDATDVDSLVLTYTNKGNLSAALTNTNVVHVIKGDFANLATADFKTTTAAVAPATVTTALTGDDASAVVSGTAGAEDTLTVTLLAVNTSLDGSTTITVDFDKVNAAVNIPSTGDIEATVTANNTDDNTDAVVTTLATKANAGEWAIDATIINVPYFPVGYDGVTSTIQLANEGTADVDIIATANDQDGNQYGPVNLDTLAGDFADGLAGDTVTKLSAMQVMTLLSAPAESNLSITFNVDANEGVVNGYAFTQKPGTGRTEISTSQQRGN
jgi:hypothetical protein